MSATEENYNRDQVAESQCIKMGLVMIECYQPTGKFRGSIFLWALLGLLWACAGMFVYQFLLYWIPLIYVNFFLTIGAGMVLAFAVGYAINKGHCRNPVLAMLLALLIGCAGLAAKFYFQYDQMISASAKELINDPELQAEADGQTLNKGLVKKALRQEFSFMDHIRMRVENGWSIGRMGANGAPLSGMFVYLVWLIEAGIVLFICVTAARASAGEPYNERLNEWANEEESLVSIPTNESAIASISQATNIDQLLQLPPVVADATNHFLTYKTHSIPGEELENAFLSVGKTTVTVNDKGELRTEEDEIHNFAVITPEQRVALVNSAEQRNADIAAMAGTESTDEVSEDNEESDA